MKPMRPVEQNAQACAHPTCVVVSYPGKEKNVCEQEREREDERELPTPTWTPPPSPTHTHKDDDPRRNPTYLRGHADGRAPLLTAGAGVGDEHRLDEHAVVQLH